MKILTPNIISGSIGNTNMDSLSITNSTVSGSFSGSFQGDGSTITGIDLASLAPKFKDSSVISALDIDWNSSQTYTKTLTGNTVFTFSNLYVGVKSLIITGNFTVGFPTGFTLTTDSNSYDGTKTCLISVECWDTVTPVGLIHITYSV